MRAFKCDRCGKYYDRFAISNDFVVTIGNCVTNGIQDLCPDCHKNLNDWMEVFKNAKENLEVKKEI